MKKRLPNDVYIPERAEVSMNHKMGLKRGYESEPVAASRVWIRAFGEGTDSAEGENEPVNRTNHGRWWPLIAARGGEVGCMSNAKCTRGGLVVCGEFLHACISLSLIHPTGLRERP